MTFRELHQGGCFVMPNPWDAGTAMYLKRLGFQALATTSSGLSFSKGLPDTDWAVPMEMTLANISDIVRATDLPVNADFESGFAHHPEGVAMNVARCVATGVAGLSIEDATGNPQAPLYELPLAIERIKAARAAMDPSVLLTARTECYLTGHPEARGEALRRLTAFAEAGADVLYAPGPRSREDIAAIVAAVAPKPVNILMSANTQLRVADLAELGVRRISLGSSLARTAWGAFIRAANEIAREGTFAAFDHAAPYAELNGFFRDELTRSRSVVAKPGDVS